MISLLYIFWTTKWGRYALAVVAIVSLGFGFLWAVEKHGFDRALEGQKQSSLEREHDRQILDNGIIDLDEHELRRILREQASP